MNKQYTAKWNQMYLDSNDIVNSSYHDILASNMNWLEP